MVEQQLACPVCDQTHLREFHRAELHLHSVRRHGHRPPIVKKSGSDAGECEEAHHQEIQETAQRFSWPVILQTLPVRAQVCFSFSRTGANEFSLNFYIYGKSGSFRCILWYCVFDLEVVVTFVLAVVNDFLTDVPFSLIVVL